MAAIQAVYVRSHEERKEPKSHVVFRIEVQAGVRGWQMWRRYSEFEDLVTELSSSTGEKPTVELPPKHALRITSLNESQLEERRLGLEAFLRAIVASKDHRWRDSVTFQTFIGVPVGSSASAAATSYTPASWLDAHTELQGVLRDVRAALNKRDALSAANDVVGAHSANVAAKKSLAATMTRVGVLAAALEKMSLAPGETQRRTQMVARLQDDCERLGKMVVAARQSSRPGLAASSGPPVQDSDRNELLGGAPNVRVARVFGRKEMPQETDATRPLDNAGVFQLQQTRMDEQDAQVSQLSAILARQKQLGIAIGNEIEEQIELLDDLTDNVDRTGSKLSAAKKQLNRLG